jgi:glycosyltransferase involved in cell wall biosynthesis
MREPTVSVVIPAFRAARTIARSVESVLRQTRLPDEILIVDDGSPDDLLAALSRHVDQVTLIRKVNGGAASARNVGIERARGEWIAFLDADDYWEPLRLERQLDVLRFHPQVRMLGARWFDQVCDAPRVRSKVGEAEAQRYFDSPLRATGKDIFDIAMLIWTSTVLVHRDQMLKHRFESGLEPAEDRDMWVRLVSDCTLYLLPEPLATYVQEPGSLSRSNIDRDCGNMLRVIHRHADLLGQQGRREWEAHLYRRWAGAHLSFGDPVNALRPACKRLQYDPGSLEAWWVLFKSVAGMAPCVSKWKAARG